MKREQISKLPKWAQSEFETLQRQRDTAINRLDEMTDNQKESPFYKDEFDCTNSPPVSRKVYYQAGMSMSVDHAGVWLQIILRDGYIDLQWGRPRHLIGEICFTPSSYQAARLLTKESMR